MVSRVLARKMADLSSWVSDQLHDVLGFSDKHTTEYLISLAKSATDSQSLVRRISEGFDVDKKMIGFANDLWAKVPHKQQAENPYRARERALVEQQQKFANYSMVSDDDDDGELYEAKRKGVSKKDKKRKHLRKVCHVLLLLL